MTTFWPGPPVTDAATKLVPSDVFVVNAISEPQGVDQARHGASHLVHHAKPIFDTPGRTLCTLLEEGPAGIQYRQREGRDVCRVQINRALSDWECGAYGGVHLAALCIPR